jgi:hypothetical protein
VVVPTSVVIFEVSVVGEALAAGIMNPVTSNINTISIEAEMTIVFLLMVIHL